MDEYLVRGALLSCDCGSHKRKMNLLKSHGAVVGENEPLVHAKDSILEDNITFFGVCTGGSPPAGEDVYLQKEGTFDENGNRKTVGFGVVTGPQCVPDIIGEWEIPYRATLIADDANPKGVPSITMKSFLICSHGGIIKPVVSGQRKETPNQSKLEEDLEEFKMASVDLLAKVDAVVEGTIDYHMKKAVENLSQSSVAKAVQGILSWFD